MASARRQPVLLPSSGSAVTRGPLHGLGLRSANVGRRETAEVGASIAGLLCTKAVFGRSGRMASARSAPGAGTAAVTSGATCSVIVGSSDQRTRVGGGRRPPSVPSAAALVGMVPALRTGWPLLPDAPYRRGWGWHNTRCRPRRRRCSRSRRGVRVPARLPGPWCGRAWPGQSTRRIQRSSRRSPGCPQGTPNT